MGGIACAHEGIRRHDLESFSTKIAPQYPSIVDLRWRVDVAISTSKQARSLRPTVLMETALSDGSLKTFEVSAEKFQALRFNVTRALHEVLGW